MNFVGDACFATHVAGESASVLIYSLTICTALHRFVFDHPNILWLTSAENWKPQGVVWK
jgi:hypothetical protein